MPLNLLQVHTFTLSLVWSVGGGRLLNDDAFFSLVNGVVESCYYFFSTEHTRHVENNKKAKK